MMVRNFIIIANPLAGSSNARNILDYIIRYFTIHQIAFKIVFTSKNKFCGLGTISTILHDYTDIIVLGGDGTINAVVNAIVNQPLPISIIPTGTGNDFVKSLGIPKDFKQAFDIALHGRSIMVDIGICNDWYFVNGVGIGFDGKVVEYMTNHSSFWKGHLAYLTTVLKILITFRESMLTYIINQKAFSEKTFLMTIANGSTFGGGFKITPNAKIDDGLLDVCLVKQIHPIRRLLKLFSLKKGRHGNMKEVEFMQTSAIRIESSDILTAHIDGEFLGYPPFNIKVVPSKIPFRIKV